MALIYREHRGSFEESMKTAHKIKSRNELDADRFVEYGYDRRLNSATMAVIKDDVIIGFITREESE